MDPTTSDVLGSYTTRIQDELGEPESLFTSKDYDIFRREALEKNVTFYERCCAVAERILPVSPSAKDRPVIEQSIEYAHLNLTPEGAGGFAALVSFSFIILGILIGALTYLYGNFFVFTTLVLVLVGAVLVKPLTKLPLYFATRWRLEASNQMVLCILYIVIYMRHTSNLEHALKFAGEHIGVPLGLDLKKVLWDIETERFLTIQESLNYYLERWREHSVEFVEAFHLVQGSLYEPDEQRRIQLLEKGLQVVLDGTYDKMLHYAHNLRSPITILYMLGVILPILGLVIFPLLGSFLAGAVRWYHLAILYNLLLPCFVYGLGMNIMNKRPTGYGEGEVLRTNPRLRALAEAPGALFAAILGGGILVLLGLFPIILHLARPEFDVTFLGYLFLDYKSGFGPYGFWALLISFFIPLGLAVGLSVYYSMKSKRLMEYREKTDILEQEFSGALFQLGNRIGDGLPTETAFSHVAESMKGTQSGSFFALVDANLRSRGMPLQAALFDPEHGAIAAYPSNLIESTMKILVQSSRKGPRIVSSSLITISTYLDQIRKVNERLRDLMADVLSSMTSQVTFLTPIIAGIVVGVGSMVVTIINLLSTQFETVGAAGEAGFAGGVATIANILRVQDVIPGYQFQFVVGLFVVEMGIILTVLSTLLERGIDTTTIHHRIGKNVFKSTGLYLLVSLIGVVLFNFLANAVTLVGTAAG